MCSGAGTGGPGGPLAPPIFGGSVNPIPTMWGRFCPIFISGTLNVFHFPTSLKFSMILKFLPRLFRAVNKNGHAQCKCFTL